MVEGSLLGRLLFTVDLVRRLFLFVCFVFLPRVQRDTELLAHASSFGGNERGGGKIYDFIELNSFSSRELNLFPIQSISN